MSPERKTTVTQWIGIALVAAGMLAGALGAFFSLQGVAAGHEKRLQEIEQSDVRQWQYMRGIGDGVNEIRINMRVDFRQRGIDYIENDTRGR